MSWNGATNVASWRVLAGSDASRMSARASVLDSGFESSAELVGGSGPGALGKVGYVEVQALSSNAARCWQAPLRCASRATRAPTQCAPDDA